MKAVIINKNEPNLLFGVQHVIHSEQYTHKNPIEII